MNRFTPAQRRAFLWLPADGSWSKPADKSIAPALSSLTLYHKALAEDKWGPFGKRGGGWFRHSRLTAAGVMLRKGLPS